MVGMSSRGLRADCEAAIDSDSGSKWIARFYKHHCQQNVDQRSLKASWRGKKETETPRPGKRRSRCQIIIVENGNVPHRTAPCRMMK